MIEIRELIWDEWNKLHVLHHGITPEEVIEAIGNSIEIKKSYRKRLQLIGKTKNGLILAVVLSGEDRNGIQYEDGIFYVITAYKKEGI